jgi:hypothetical protein
MSDQQVNVKFGAETGQLKDGANQAAQSVENTVGRMSGAFANMATQMQGHASGVVNQANGMANGIQSAMGRVDGIMSKMTGGFAALSAVLAGGAFFKSAIEETKQFTGEVTRLSKALGITVEEAATLNVALGDVYASADTFIGASQAMTRQLKTNEQAVKDMGVQTRDASGNLRPMNDIIMDSIKTLNDYREGTDRSLAAQKLFGRGASDAMQMLKLNNEVLEEARKKQQALGLTISQENVDAMKRYKAAMNDAGDVTLALKKVVGDALIPILSDLGEEFAESGPQRVAIMRAAINSLVTTFYVLKTGVETIWLTIKAFVQGAAVAILSLADAWQRLQNLDMDGAKEALKRGIEQAGDILDESAKEAEKRGMAAWDKINAAWSGKSTPAAKAPGGTKTIAEGTDEASKNKSRVGEWDLMLDRQKLAHEKINADNGTFYEFGKQRESDYWAAILARHDLSKDERIGVEKKYIGLLLDSRKEAFQTELMRLKTELDAFKYNQDERLRIANEIAAQVAQRYGKDSKEYEASQQAIIQIERAKKEQIKAIDDEMRAGRQAQALYEIDAADRQAQLDVQLGLKTNAELLAQQSDFEAQRNAVKLAALKERQDAASLDPDMNPVEYAKIGQQIEELERQHQQKMGDIRSRQVLESSKNYTSMFSTLQSGFQSILTQFGKGTMTLGAMVRGLMTTVLDAVTGTLAKMAAEWLMRQIQQRVLGKITALTQITDASAVSGANAFASTAAIPIIGPELAPAAAMAASAGAMGFASRLSAKSGFDVPAGINPIMQIHEKEMVLPSAQADVIRGMAEGGGGGGGNVTLHINAVDGKSVRDLFMREGAALADAIQRQARNMKMTGASLRGA